ncbi:hypothetical protein FRC02_004182 [Tulasnella sp. 418]|nr:hypothetical protein FRC02_004182 [Tulasnella sp. 418]
MSDSEHSGGHRHAQSSPNRSNEEQGTLIAFDRSDSRDAHQNVELSRATIATTVSTMPDGSARRNIVQSSSSSSQRPAQPPMDAAIAMADIPNCASRPASILSLLHCAFCSSILDSPTTLRCGHSVCSHHVTLSPPPSPTSNPSPQPSLQRRASTASVDSSSQSSSTSIPLLPSCPVKSCSPANSRTPRPFMEISPLSSKVAYYPPPPVPEGRISASSKNSSPKVIKVASPRQDVSMARILPIVVKATRAREKLLRTSDPKSFDLDDPSSGDESDTSDEASDPLMAPNPTLSQAPLTPRPSSPAPLAIAHSLTSPAPSSSSFTERHARSRSPPTPEAPYQHNLKRPRIQTPSPRIPPLQLDSSEEALAKLEVEFAKQLYGELLCEICFSVLLNPVTTPCQHTFCSKCLSRTLDHSLQCPLCRQELPGYAYFYDHAVNKVISSIIIRAFPQVHADREAALAEEERIARLDTPIFVCQLSFPGMPTLLHFFEPRYRLMLRRCLQSPNPAFGIVMPPQGPVGNEGNDYGTMLEIVSVQMLPDGRSMVETRGTYRFRIVERGNLDGYLVGRIQRIDDYSEDVESMLTGLTTAGQTNESSTAMTSAVPPQVLESTNEELMQICRDFYEQIKSGAAPWVVQQLNNTYGAMPEDLSTFTFWMALLLPIDEREKAKLLPIRSPRLRLRLLVYWIENLNNSWWFGQGCVIG